VDTTLWWRILSPEAFLAIWVRIGHLLPYTSATTTCTYDIIDDTGRRVAGDAPHAWVAADLLNLLRMMFVMERNNRIVIFAGVKDEWLDQPMVIENLPTYFGLNLLRMMFVMERNDRIVIFAGVKDEWLDQPMVIENLPTYFGQIDAIIYDPATRSIKIRCYNL